MRGRPGAVLATLLCACGALTACAPLGARVTHPTVGETVGDLTLPDLDADGDISLSALRGRAVVVNLWAAWCGPCRAEEPGLAAAARAHPGVAFLGIDYRDDVAQARAFRRTFAVPYPSMVDGAGASLPVLGVAYIPATLLINPSGTLLQRHLGGMPEQVLDSWLAALRPSPAAI